MIRKTDFCVGMAGYPEKQVESPNTLTDLGYLKQKVDAGAEYIAIQICYEYVILTNGGDYMESHEHILSHHIFRPDMIVPEYVRELLLKGLRKTRDQQ